MAYTDKDLQAATQIAYYDLDEIFKEYKNSHPGSTTVKLQELLEYAGGDNSDIRKKFSDEYNKALKEGNEINAARFKESLKLYDTILTEGSEYGNWKLKDVCDKNSTSGFYACVIETGKDNAIVGFRGSESNDLHDVITDWGKADLNLLNNTLTDQQRDATQYMKKVGQMPYANFALTGHSLGGNLCDHATLTASNDVKNRIQQSVSFDGPGFSDEYIEMHKNDILQMCGKMTHYQWSVVGSLLFLIPGSNQVHAKTAPLVYEKDDMKSLVFKHDTGFLVYDENGKLVEGQEDFLASVMGAVSKGIDCFTDDNPELRAKLTLLLDVINYAGPMVGKNIQGFFKAIGAAFSKVGEFISHKSAYNPKAVREFTDATYKEFMSITDAIKREKFYDVTKWDIWYRVENVFGGINLSDYNNKTNVYYRKIFDMNGFTCKKITEIFQKVNETDRVFAKKISALIPDFTAITQSLTKLANGLQTIS